MNKPRGEGGYLYFWVGWRVFSPKRPKMGSVNSVFMRFSITIFPGRVSDFRLRGGEGESLPPRPMCFPIQCSPPSVRGKHFRRDIESS